MRWQTLIDGLVNLLHKFRRLHSICAGKEWWKDLEHSHQNIKGLAGNCARLYGCCFLLQNPHQRCIHALVDTCPVCDVCDGLRFFLPLDEQHQTAQQVESRFEMISVYKFLDPVLGPVVVAQTNIHNFPRYSACAGCDAAAAVDKDFRELTALAIDHILQQQRAVLAAWTADMGQHHSAQKLLRVCG